MINENRKKLLNICKNDNLFIVNGRIGSSKQCKFTCHTARGQSVVDYIIMDGETLRKVTKFSVDDVTPLSDHSSVRVTLNTQVEPVYNRVSRLDYVHTTDGKTPIKNNTKNQSTVLNHNNSLNQLLIISLQVTQM